VKEYTIADILHYAADKKLASKESQCWNRGGNKEKYSCCAVSEAVWELYNNDKIVSEGKRDELINRCTEGLKAMGCPTDSLDAFDDFGEFSAKNQQARYAWLKFAAIMAEEQGV
jgi:hypothetical protein